MTEAFLQYVWQHRLLQGGLKTVDGLQVVVERVGDLNYDAGPDFIDVRLMVDGVLWAGNVEIHIKASDWRQHKHSEDKNYNNVVLHVVYEYDCDICLENGCKVATMVIKDNIPQAVWEQYEKLMSSPVNGEVPCAPFLEEVPSFVVTGCVDRLVVERVERKSEDVKRLLAESRGSWETCCYWLLAKYFGGKTNGFVFELLAKATDQRLLARWKDQPQRIEALLMGQAGLLDGYFEDEYPRILQADYEGIRGGTQIKPIDGYLWKFFRLWPSSFPTIRISQFAQLVSKSNNLFGKLLEMRDAKDLIKLFDVEASEYWETHYQFDKESKKSKKRAGKDFVEMLLINAWVPLLMEYGNQHGQQEYKDQALGILSQLEAENNKIVRMWHGVGMKAENATESQGLLQLYNEYCKNRRCLECQLGYQVMVRNNKRGQKAFLKKIGK